MLQNDMDRYRLMHPATCWELVYSPVGVYSDDRFISEKQYLGRFDKILTSSGMGPRSDYEKTYQFINGTTKVYVSVENGKPKLPITEREGRYRIVPECNGITGITNLEEDLRRIYLTLYQLQDRYCYKVAYTTDPTLASMGFSQFKYKNIGRRHMFKYRSDTDTLVRFEYRPTDGTETVFELQEPCNSTLGGVFTPVRNTFYKKRSRRSNRTRKIFRKLT